jgi:Tat protein secretion system quality control protein TatD with DNase activity
VDVAIRLGRNISFHSVRAPQETVETLKRFKKEKEGWEKIHICLHSFGGSAESAVQIQKGLFAFLFLPISR